MLRRGKQRQPGLYCSPPPPPVDTPGPPTHFAPVKKKPHKVEEATTPYTAKKPVKPARPALKTEGSGVRYMDDDAFKKTSDKVFKVHKDLFRKLAQ